MKIKGDVFRRKFQKAGIGKTDVVNDKDDYFHHDYEDTSEPEIHMDTNWLGEQMRGKLQFLVELNNAQRHDMANDVLLELYNMCDQVTNVEKAAFIPAHKMGSLKDLI